MEGLDLLGKKAWKPLSSIGLKHWFFDINFSTVVNTWVIITLLLVALIPLYFLIKKNHGLVHFVVTSFVDFFVKLTEQALERFSFIHFTFVAGLFTFILLCNIISLIPWLEEPTQDLNTTLALGISAFIYVQFFAIKTHGLWEYSKEYFSPFFLMFPLNVIGKLATIVSLSFRLFGNIFGGVIIAKLLMSSIEGKLLLEIPAMPINFAVNSLFFGLFEGALQAFVFTMLTVTYLSVATQKGQEMSTEESK